MKKYYVYEYVHPDTKQPFYVGKGCGRRAYVHLYESYKKSTNRRRYSIIKNLLMQGKTPIIHIVGDNMEEQAALSLEKDLILKYGNLLVNILPGGRQPPKGKGNPLWKVDNPSSKTKGMTYEERYGLDRTKEILLKRSKSLQNRTFSNDTKHKMSVAARNRDRSSYHKPIITPDGAFDSGVEASAYYLVSPSTIIYRVKSTAPQWSSWSYG